jgi:signal transduction histidine kinase
MRIYILYLCFSIISVSALSQPASINIALLEQKISISKNDTNKISLYLSLIYYLVSNSSSDKAFIVAQKAFVLSTQLNFKHGLIFSLCRMGSVEEVTNRDYLKAIGYYKEAIKIAEKNGTYNDLNSAYGCILNMYYYIGDYPAAMVIAQKGLAVAERKNDNESLAHYYNQFGFIYLNQEKPVEAIKYYSQYLTLANQVGSQSLVADAYTSMADAYLFEKDYTISLQYLFKALKNYQKADNLAIPFKDKYFKGDRIAYTFFKISNAYKLQRNYKLSLQYALSCFNYRDKRYRNTYNPYDLASYYINIGEVYMGLKDYGNAMQFLNKGLTLSTTIKHRQDMLDAYSGLSQTFALQKRYDSAYRYQGLFATLKDSIINEKASRAVEQIRSRFESDKKDKEIAMLSQKQRLKETESEKKTLMLNIVIGFFTLLTVISYLIIYIGNNHKKQKQAFEKQLAVQIERQRISGDMHDDIGTGLSTMLLYINMLKSKLNGKLEYPDIERVSSLGNELVAQMKEIVWSLNPGNDSLESLLVFIRQYFAQLFEPLPYRTNIIFPVAIPDIAVKGSIRRNIYLCIKEAFNNVIKHASADWVELEIQLFKDKLIVNVRDNGTGFPDNSGSKFFSNGLKNMQNRMNQVNGKFHFFNENGAVISIELQLPGVPKGVVVQ